MAVHCNISTRFCVFASTSRQLYAVIMTDDEARAAANEWLGLYGNSVMLRSCWNCNKAHEYLRDAPYVMLCFECGHAYFLGVKLTKDDDA